MVHKILCALMLSGVSLGHASDATVQSTILRAVAPAYPDAAKLAHVNADITIVVTVDVSGKVTEAKPQRTFEPFGAPCLKAASEWRFSPRSQTAAEELRVLTFRFRIVGWNESEESDGTVFETPTTMEIRARMHKPEAIASTGT